MGINVVEEDYGILYFALEGLEYLLALLDELVVGVGDEVKGSANLCLHIYENYN